jgi:hypothetical protein
VAIRITQKIHISISKIFGGTSGQRVTAPGTPQSLVAQMSEKVGDALKATIEATVVAAVEPLKTEIGQLAGRVSTIEQQFASFGDNFDSILEAKIESKVAARLGTVDETVRASYEAIDNTLTSCLLSVETLERKLRSPNAILFGVAESLGEQQLTQVKSLLGDTSINDTFPSCPAPRAGSHQVFFHCSKACGF